MDFMVDKVALGQFATVAAFFSPVLHTDVRLYSISAIYS
jgi:hypothetical protein